MDGQDCPTGGSDDPSEQGAYDVETGEWGLYEMEFHVITPNSTHVFETIQSNISVVRGDYVDVEASCAVCNSVGCRPAESTLACSRGRQPRGSICLPCPAGNFKSIYAKVSHCQSCPAGKFSKAVGATACQLCEAGQYMPKVGRSVCYLCHDAEIAGETTCDGCPSGMVSTTSRNFRSESPVHILTSFFLQSLPIHLDAVRVQPVILLTQLEGHRALAVQRAITQTPRLTRHTVRCVAAANLAIRPISTTKVRARTVAPGNILQLTLPQVNLTVYYVTQEDIAPL